MMGWRAISQPPYIKLMLKLSVRLTEELMLNFSMSLTSGAKAHYALVRSSSYEQVRMHHVACTWIDRVRWAASRHSGYLHRTLVRDAGIV